MAAYLIADIQVNDGVAYEEYRRLVPAIIAAHGGRYLVRGGATQVLEGDWQPRRTVVIEFSDMAALKSFYASPEYRKILELRENASFGNLIAVEGV